MKTITRFAGVGGLALAATVLLAGQAQASPAQQSAPVFVQTDDPAGNTIVAYDRAADGSLQQAGIYPTGGLGGVLAGSVVDHLASQGSLAFDRANGLLYAVNAGSDTVTVFTVHGDRLIRRQVITSGGDFPVSIAVHGNRVYVLNARDGGSRPGLPAPRRHPAAGARLAPRARPGPDADARVHPHPGAGRVHPGRPQSRRHHQGQRQRHRRIRHQPARRPVGAGRS